MGQQKQLKVIIVGASVSGLTLANCLEKAGIEYVLLEKGRDIVYEGGASIGLMANGLRIMDQLDAYDDIRKAAAPLHTTYHRSADGKSYASSSYMGSLEAKHGYPVLFFERRELLEILHSKIPDKTKVHTSTRVKAIKTSPSHVTVTSEDGSIYEGDIVVGTDGVNSAVRHCMWSDMEAKEAQLVKCESTAMFSEYCCIFGFSILKGTPVNFTPGLSHVVYDNKIALGAIVGINDKVFWFVFIKLDKKYYAPNIPHFSLVQAEAIAETHVKRQITEEVSFGDLWERRVRFTVAALEEGVMTRWFNERTVLVGDAAHKMTPNAGQGANTAIESAALLSNLLYRAKAKHPDRKISTGEFSKLFEEYQAAQQPRATNMFEASMMMTRLQTKDNIGLSIFSRRLLPLLGDSFQINFASELLLGGGELDFVEKQLLDGNIPFNGWAPWTTVEPGTAFWLKELMNYTCLAIAWCVIQRFVNNKALSEPLSRLLPLRLASFLLNNRAMENTTFLIDILPAVGISMIESLRPNHSARLSSLPIFTGIAFQVGGAPLCALVYFLAHAIQLRGSRARIPGGDIVEPKYAKNLNATLLVIYPLVALAATGTIPVGKVLPQFFPGNRLKREVWLALPALLAVVHRLLAKRAQRKALCLKKQNDFIRGHDDLPYLRKTYALLTAVPALFHIYKLGPLLVRGAFKQALTQCLFPTGSWDYLVVHVAGIVWTFANFSKAAQVHGIFAHARLALISGMTSLVIGPGAFIAAMWGLREEAVRAY